MSRHSQVAYVVNAHGIALVHSRDGQDEILRYHDEHARIGFYYDSSEGGGLLRHGCAEAITQRHQADVQKLAAFPEMASDLRVFAFPATLLRAPEILEAVNHALASSGRMNQMVEQVQSLAGALPAERQRTIQALMALPGA